MRQGCKRGDSSLPSLVERRDRSDLPLTFFAAMALLAGCGFVHDERLDGPYRLNAIDVMSEMSICYDLGNGHCVDEFRKPCSLLDGTLLTWSLRDILTMTNQRSSISTWFA